MEGTKRTGYPSIDKPWLQYYSEEAINAKLPECTVYENAWQHNKDHLDEAALIYFGRKISYRTVFQQVDCCAVALERAGIQRGMRFALMLSCIPEAVYLVLAASKIGAVVCFINPMADERQKLAQLCYCDTKQIFVMDVMIPYIEDIIEEKYIDRIIIIPTSNSMSWMKKLILRQRTWNRKYADLIADKSDRFIMWDTFLLNCNTNSDTSLISGDLPLALVYSSGTTGTPKAIVLTNRGINATIEQYVYANSVIERSNRFLTILPFYTSTGLIVCLLMPLCLGVTCVLEPSYGSTPFIESMKKYRINYTFAPTSLWISFARATVERRLNLDYLRQPIIGGEAFPVELETMLNNILDEHNSKAKMQKGCGMCELGSTATTTSDIHNILGSAGIPLPCVIVSAFAPHTNKELTYGQRGELRVVTPSRMDGYQNNPKATNNFFCTDISGREWACSGDIGYISEDGDVFVLGRMNDSYLTRYGETVYLFDIERVIATDSAVELCEVVDMEIAGVSYPVAHLILKESDGSQWEATIRRIHTACQCTLPENAVPYCYKIRGRFPLKREVQSGTPTPSARSGTDL